MSLKSQECATKRIWNKSQKVFSCKFKKKFNLEIQVSKVKNVVEQKQKN